MTNNKPILHNGSWLLVDVKAELKGFYFDSFINQIRNTNGANYVKAEHTNLILASQTKLEGIPLLLKENVEMKIKEAREETLKLILREEMSKWFVDDATHSFESQFRLAINYMEASQFLKMIISTIKVAALSSGKEQKYSQDDLRWVLFKLGNVIFEKATNGKYSTSLYMNQEVETVIAEISLTPQQEMFAELLMEENQCDGCKRNIPVMNGAHHDDKTFGIGCTKHLYNHPKLTPEGAVTITKIHIK